MPVFHSAPEYIRGFNVGSDARIAGHPRTACPYALGSQERYGWYAGWDHVDQNWGHDAKGLARPLPPVRHKGPAA